MPRKVRITQDMLIQAGVELILTQGLGALNIRSLAAQLDCSIQPIFRNFGTMEVLREKIICALGEKYNAVIDASIDKEDYLFTISLAHVALARDHRNLFEVMFLAGVYGARTVQQIIHSSWNREAIQSTSKQYGISLAQAEEVYRDVRFYTFGIAQAVYAGSVILAEGEDARLLHGAIEKFTEGYRR